MKIYYVMISKQLTSESEVELFKTRAKAVKYFHSRVDRLKKEALEAGTVLNDKELHWEDDTDAWFLSDCFSGGQDYYLRWGSQEV